MAADANSHSHEGYGHLDSGTSVYREVDDDVDSRSTTASHSGQPLPAPRQFTRPSVELDVAQSFSFQPATLRGSTISEGTLKKRYRPLRPDTQAHKTQFSSQIGGHAAHRARLPLSHIEDIVTFVPPSNVSQNGTSHNLVPVAHRDTTGMQPHEAQSHRAGSANSEILPSSRAPSPEAARVVVVPDRVDSPHLTHVEVQDEDKQLLMNAAALMEARYRNKCEVAVQDIKDNQLAPLESKFRSLQQVHSTAVADAERLQARDKQLCADVATANAKVAQLTKEKESLTISVSAHERTERDLRSAMSELQAGISLKDHFTAGLDGLASKVRDLVQTVSKPVLQEPTADTQVKAKLDEVLKAVQACSQQLSSSQSNLEPLRDQINTWDQSSIQTSVSAITTILKEISSNMQAEHNQSQKALSELHSAFEPMPAAQQHFMHQLEEIAQVQSRLSSQITSLESGSASSGHEASAEEIKLLLSQQMLSSQKAESSLVQLRGELLSSTKGIENLLNGDIATQNDQTERFRSEITELRGHLQSFNGRLELSTQEHVLLQKENARLRSELNDSRSKLQETENSATTAKVQMLFSEEKTTTAQREVDLLNGRIATLETRLSEASNQSSSVDHSHEECKKLLAKSLQEFALETQHLLEGQRGLHINETHELKNQLASLQQAMDNLRTANTTVSVDRAQQTDDLSPRPTSPASSELSSVHSGGMNAAEIGELLQQAISPSFLDGLSQASSIAPFTPREILKSTVPPNSSSKRAQIQSQGSVGVGIAWPSRPPTARADQDTLDTMSFDLDEEDECQILVPDSAEKSQSSVSQRFTQIHTKSPRSIGRTTTTSSSPNKRKRSSRQTYQPDLNERPAKSSKRLASAAPAAPLSSKTGLRSEGRVIRGAASQQSQTSQRKSSGKTAATPRAKKSDAQYLAAFNREEGIAAQSKRR